MDSTKIKRDAKIFLGGTMNEALEALRELIIEALRMCDDLELLDLIFKLLICGR